MAKTPVDALHRQQMQSLLESGELSDVTLVVVEGLLEQKEFKVHRSLLSAFSPVFSAMFSHTDTKEALEKLVVIEDVSANAIGHLVSFIYTGELKFDEKEKEKSLLEFLAAIDKYQVHLIKDECESLLSDLVTIDSVCAILQSADLHSAPTLKEQCFGFIAKNSDQVVSRDSKSAWAQFEAAARPELLKEIFYRLAAKVKKEPTQCCHCKRKHLRFYCSYCGNYSDPER